MRIAICDEHTVHREELLGLLRRALSGEPVSYQVREYSGARDMLYDVEDGESPDVIFVDMGTQNGWESVGALRRLHFEGDIILMSDCGERAVDGYALGADGYLMKPFEAQAVEELLERLCRRVQKSCLTISRYRQIVRIPYHEIVYIESQNAKCKIHRIGGEEYTVYVQLDMLETQLDDPRFLRCHQSYLVNMDHIVSADKHFEMINGDAVSIRQRERHRLRECYCEYLRSIGGCV